MLILPGDGIGPEVVRQVYRVIDWLAKARSLDFEVEERLVGGAAIDAEGAPISDETIADATAADAVLLGAVGGPKWETVSFERRPEAGLLPPSQGLGVVCEPPSRKSCLDRWQTRRR